MQYLLQDGSRVVVLGKPLMTVSHVQATCDLPDMVAYFSRCTVVGGRRRFAPCLREVVTSYALFPVLIIVHDRLLCCKLDGSKVCRRVEHWL